jgi:hypothetical protein
MHGVDYESMVEQTTDRMEELAIFPYEFASSSRM